MHQLLMRQPMTCIQFRSFSHAVGWLKSYKQNSIPPLITRYDAIEKPQT